MTDPVVAKAVEMFVKMAELNVIDPGPFSGCNGGISRTSERRHAVRGHHYPHHFVVPRWQPGGPLERITN